MKKQNANWLFVIFLIVNHQLSIINCIAQIAPSKKIQSQIIEGEKRAAQSRMNFQENPLSANYDIVYGQCFWNIDPAVRFISGHINTYFVPASSLTSITLDLSDSLVADSVLYQSQQTTFSHSGNLLTINFPSSLSTGTTYSADIYYHGIPPTDTLGFGSFGQMKHGTATDSSYAIWTLSEPYGAYQWWPCKNSLADKIDSMDIFVSTPSQYHDGSNGELVSENTIGGFTTCHWKHRYPIATYLVSLNVAKFSIFTEKAIYLTDTLPILNYIWKEDSANARTAIQGFIPGLLLYDSLFGIYPFQNEKYGHAEMGWGGGMEHQTMTYAGNFYFELLVHECAHQWFGDKVTCGSWEDIFLNEGFATYLTDLCYEFLFNGYYWKFWKDNNLSSITSQPDGSVWVNDTTDVNRIFDGRLSYEKGGYFLHQLRYQVGDSAFFAGVRNYLADTLLAYNFSRWTDLKTHIENASGKNLSTYFNQWFFGEGFPSYQLSWSQDVSNLVNLTVNQSTSKPSSVSFFELDIPVEFKNAIKDTIVRLANTFSGQTYSIQLPFHADSAKFDPEQWLITANNTVTGISSLSELSNEIIIYPNPSVDGKFQISGFKFQIKEIEIYNVYGEKIFSKTVNSKFAIANPTFGVQETVNLNALSGIYLLKITTDAGELYKKLSVIR